VEMFTVAEKLKVYLRELYNWDPEIRVGIHYGRVIVGSIGSLSRADHSLPIFLFAFFARMVLKV